MDEISTLGPTMLTETSPDSRSTMEFDASKFFVRPAGPDALLGGDASENAQLLVAILSGEKRGPARDIVVLNAAGALQAAGAVAGWDSAIARATESIDSGAAARVLAEMRRLAS